MIEKIKQFKQKITDLIDRTELRRFMLTLRFIFQRSEDDRIKRTSKSLHDLLYRETYDKIDGLDKLEDDEVIKG